MRRVALRVPLLACSLYFLFSFLLALPAAAAQVAFDLASLTAAAKSLPAAGELRIAAVPLAEGNQDRLRDLRLERFEVFAPNAKIVLHTDFGEVLLPRPANIYMRGKIDGDPRSRAVVTVLESGEVRGLVTTTGRYWLLGAAAGETLLRSRELGGLELAQEDGEFTCEVDGLGQAAFRAAQSPEADPGAGLPAAGPLANLLANAAGKGAGGETRGTLAFDHTAVIAIETDNEFLNLGPIAGNTTTATNYIADLVAYASTIYTVEIQTTWSLGHVSLWQTTDPWQQTSTSCGLIDFGRYWNNNNSSITRTVTHFLSGKSTNAGVAWIGVLCNGGFSIDAAQVATGCSPPLTGTSNWGGGYGYSSGIDANFNINSPSIVWDILAFSHEIGHNFNSGHTHCYQNIGGNANSVDNCYAGQCGQTGCYCGATALPSGCPGSGQGCGTIMSYCHLLSPGQSNTTLTLGLGHPYGVAPSRVPSRMRDHVVSVAASNPSCLAPISASVIFEDGFESGNTSNWN